MKYSVIVGLFLTASLARAQTQASPIVSEPTGPFVQVACTIDEVRGPCVLDSGAVMSWVADLPIFAKLAPAAAMHVSNGGASQDFSAVLVESFAVGEVPAVEQVKAVRSNKYWGLPAAIGVVGADLLIHRDLIFDFGKILNPDQAQLIAGKLSEQVLPAGVKVVFGVRVPGDKIVVQLQLGTEIVTALFDTHAHSAVSTQFIKAHPEFFSETTPIPSENLSGQTIYRRAYNLKVALKIGEGEIPAGVIRALSAKVALVNGVDMVLGMDELRRFAWAFAADSETFALITRKKP